MSTIRRSGLLALAVSFSAGIHAALVPEHLREMPALGYAFIAAAATGGVLAWALISRPDDGRIPLLAGLFCLGQIVAWALFVTVHVPGFSGTPEPVESVALLSKTAELLAVALTLPFVFLARRDTADTDRSDVAQVTHTPDLEDGPGWGSNPLTG